jgi:hypothetical protein
VTRLVFMGVVLSALLIGGILALIRTRRLQERYALLWLGAAIGVVVFGLWDTGLGFVARLFGIAYPPSALFLIVSLFLVAVIMHAVITISRLSTHVQTLAQRLALLDERLRTLEREGGGDEAEADADDPAVAELLDDGRGVRLIDAPRRRGR